jgi:hypothetical protein
MLSRALGLAAVMLLMSSLGAERALAQAQNLEAGKTPSQIFSGTCTACHKSPRGLLKTVAPGSLPGYLRQHYTTSSDMAGVLASYLISNGATDTRYAVQQKGGKDNIKDSIKDGAKEGGKDPAREATREATREARPDPHSADPTERFGHRPRAGAVAPVEGTEPRHPARADIDPQADPQATERGAEGRRSSTKQRLSRRAKPGEELPKPDAAREPSGTGDQPKSDAAKEGVKESAKEGAKEATRAEPSKSDADRSGSEGRSESARTEPARGEPTRSEPIRSEPARAEPARDTGGETPALRVDPVPPVTPAPPAGSSVTAAAGAAGDSAAQPPAAPAPTVVMPPPVAPAGPPAPPVSK